MATAVILPKQGNSVESCIIQSWHKAAGDTVSAGEVLCEVETDKAVVEVEAPCDGVLLELFAEADDDVPVLTNIAAIGDAGEDASSLRPDGAAAAEPAAEAAAEAPAAAAPVAAAAPAAVVEGAGSSPRARARAAKDGVDLAALGGTGPGGMVIERDVLAAAEAGPRLTPAAQAAMAAGGLSAPALGSGPAGRVTVADLQAGGAAPAAAAAAPGAVTEIKVKGIRKVIAERMMNSLQTTAQLTLNTSFNCAALQAYRAKVKGHADALGLPNITLNDMILFAVSRILPKYPELNAHFLGDKILQFADVNIGVAVDTDKGLMVPVVPQAQRLSLAALAATFKPIAVACIEGKATPEQLQGGTFTVTNLGAFGIEHFTPVLNAPEVAILGVSGITTQPKRGRDGSVDFEDRIALSLTIDHQATDGAPGARFLKDLVAALENFDLLLAD